MFQTDNMVDWNVMCKVGVILKLNVKNQNTWNMFQFSEDRWKKNTNVIDALSKMFYLFNVVARQSTSHSNLFKYEVWYSWGKHFYKWVFPFKEIYSASICFLQEVAL